MLMVVTSPQAGAIDAARPFPLVRGGLGAPPRNDALGRGRPARTRKEAMSSEVIVPEENKKAYETLHFAPAVHHDGLVFLSGAVGSPDGTPEEEFRQAWKSIGKTLAAAGYSYDDIIDPSLYRVDLQQNTQAMFRVKDEFIKEPYPASTWIGTTQLVIPRARAEIKIVERKKN